MTKVAGRLSEACLDSTFSGHLLGWEAFETSKLALLFTCLSYSSPGGEEEGKGLLSSWNLSLPGECTGFLTFTPKPAWKEMAQGSLQVNQQHLTLLSVLSESRFPLPSERFSRLENGERSTYILTAVCAKTFGCPSPTQFGLLKFKILGPCISKPDLGKLPEGNA